jgi:hypothetical protein
VPLSLCLESLIGTWDLLEYRVISPDGTSRPLWDDIRGRLIYSQDGYVSVVIVRQAERIGLADVICYSGKYIIEGDQIKNLIHVSTIKRYQDALEIRKVEFRDGSLTLILENHPSGEVHTVRWSKI